MDVTGPKRPADDQLREAEQLLPGLRERIEESGYSEQQFAELVRERESAGAIAPGLSPGPRSTSVYWRVAIVLVPLFGVLGYVGVLDEMGSHGASAELPQGWAGALIGVGVGVFAVVVGAVGSRVRARRGDRSA